MSAASDYSVAVVNRLIIPAFAGTGVFTGNDPATAAGDVIAYLLHWVDAQAEDDEDYFTDPEHALGSAERHWRAERGEGDDLAQDPHYYELIETMR